MRSREWGFKDDEMSLSKDRHERRAARFRLNSRSTPFAVMIAADAEASRMSGAVFSFSFMHSQGRMVANSA